MKVRINSLTGMALLAAIALFSSCTMETMCIKGNEGIQTRELPLTTFTGIDMQVAGNVSITQGPQSVKVTGHSNVLDQLNQECSGEFWNIGFTEDCFRDYDLSIEISVPDLDKVILSGSGDIQIADFKNQKELDLLLAGSGSISLSAFEGAERVTSAINGSGSIVANSPVEVTQHDVSIFGSGEYDGMLIKSNKSNVKVNGSGDVSVEVQDYLDVTINGSGNVYYKGIPRVNFSAEGSGEVIRKG